VKKYGDQFEQDYAVTVMLCFNSLSFFFLHILLYFVRSHGIFSIHTPLSIEARVTQSESMLILLVKGAQKESFLTLLLDLLEPFVVFLGKKLDSHSASLHKQVCKWVLANLTLRRTSIPSWGSRNPTPRCFMLQKLG